MDMKKKLLFVFNPCSGKAQIKNQLLDIVDTMVKADYEVTIYPTQCAGDAKEKVEAYARNGKMYSDMPLIFWKAQNAFMISHPL